MKEFKLYTHVVRELNFIFVGLKNFGRIFCFKYDVKRKVVEVEESIDLQKSKVVQFMFYLQKQSLDKDSNEIQR